MGLEPMLESTREKYRVDSNSSQLDSALVGSDPGQREIRKFCQKLLWKDFKDIFEDSKRFKVIRIQLDKIDP